MRRPAYFTKVRFLLEGAVSVTNLLTSSNESEDEDDDEDDDVFRSYHKQNTSLTTYT